MSSAAQSLNRLYLETMETALENTVLGRVRILWWSEFIGAIRRNGVGDTVDRLDKCMEASRNHLNEMAMAYATSKDPKASTVKSAQLRTQFLKSNTGKMFERFVGLGIAYVLHESDSDYCILPFKNQFLSKCNALPNTEATEVRIKLGESILRTRIDADLFAFNPTDISQNIYLISVKSTLKDRFHNVPFWNLLRLCALSEDFPQITAVDRTLLKRAKYVAICTDLAEEQPDFASAEGPRSLLQIDAALLDGAYVTASKAKGVYSTGNYFGANRDAAFHPLSDFVGGLIAGSIC